MPILSAVDPYAIVAGTPAKPLRLRQPRNIADRLIALAWWDWDHDALRAELAEYRSLTPKMDAADSTATTVKAYLGGTTGWRTDLYSAEPAMLMTNADSIALFRDLGARFTPELKSPSDEMPFNGLKQEDYAQKLVDEYVAAGIPASEVWLQSFNLDDVLYWIEAAPEFGAQAVYLMDEYDIEGYSPMDASTWPDTMEELKAMGVNYIALPTWMLVTLEDGEIVPSELAIQAKAADLKIITWTIERSGPRRAR